LEILPRDRDVPMWRHSVGRASDRSGIGVATGHRWRHRRESLSEQDVAATDIQHIAAMFGGDSDQPTVAPDWDGSSCAVSCCSPVVGLSTVATGSAWDVGVLPPPIDCGKAFSLSRTTLVNGLDSSSDLASFFVSVGFVWAVIAIVDVVFGAESVAAVNPCWTALGTFTASMD
jgi:hypothetical protein